MNRKTNHYNQGFTLFEILIYVGLIGIFLTGAMYFTIDILKGRARSEDQQMVAVAARQIMNRMSDELRSATAVSTVSTSTISYTDSASTAKTITLVGTQLVMIAGETSPLHDEKVTVSNVQFANRSSGNSTNITASFNLARGSTDQDFQTAIEVRGIAGSIPSTPGSTCAQYCQSQAYSTGTCRQNAVQCTNNGETHVSGGDSYCTVPNADTCCCL